jgi:hypothetical protein
MRTISIRMPESLHRQIRGLAMREGVSFNQIVVLTLAEKILTVLNEEHREARADEDLAGDVDDGLDARTR